jgi:hypothetical protein
MPLSERLVQGAPADAVACLEHHGGGFGALHFARGYEPGQARAHDHYIGVNLVHRLILAGRGRVGERA